MSFDANEMCRAAGIELRVLQAWIDVGWIRPQPAGEAMGFSAVDLARAELIRDLAGPMGVNEEGVGVILDLLDQLHGLRHALQCVTSAVAAQHVSVRHRIRVDARRAARLRRVRGGLRRMPADGQEEGF